MAAYTTLTLDPEDYYSDEELEKLDRLREQGTPEPEPLYPDEEE